jgi:8-oxo-dGTP pyrophosphatase MutT (NUDIX family)
MSAPIRQAATVLVLRDSPDGLELFMVKRNRKTGFLPSAWVFPGGRVDDADHVIDHPGLHGGDTLLAQLGLSREAGRAFLVAAVRETFEEAGLWLGRTPPAPETRLRLLAGELTMLDLLQAGAKVDLDALAAWSWWVTPEQERRRYDTRFLVAPATDGHALAVHDDHETVDSGWFSPARAVEQSGRGDMMMAPPTWWTLRELLPFATVAEVLAAARTRPSRPIQPILETDDGLRLLLPGHAAHPEPAIEGLPAEIRFHLGHWWASAD